MILEFCFLFLPLAADGLATKETQSGKETHRCATAPAADAHTEMASHRISARLSGLSPEQLVAFIDEQAPLWSAAAMRVAEEHAARLVEQPEWVLSEVLLSPDLAPHILAQLPIENHSPRGRAARGVAAGRRRWRGARGRAWSCSADTTAATTFNSPL